MNEPQGTETGTSGRRPSRRAVWGATAVVAVALAGGVYVAGASNEGTGGTLAAGRGRAAVDPGGSAGVSGYSITPELVDGRVCMDFDFEETNADGDSSAAQRTCDADAEATLGVDTTSVVVETTPRTDLVVIAGAASAEVARVEIDLPNAKQHAVDVALMEVEGSDRFGVGYSADRETMLDARGRFDVSILAFDGGGRLIQELELCDPAAEATGC